MIAKTPQPPYYAVIFTSIRTEGDHGYDAMAEQMHALAQKQPGFLGMETARNEIGITVSYWKDLDAIREWKKHADHQLAQQKGRKEWYRAYTTRIAKVESAYAFEK